jgi:hypothetical protein
MRSLAASFVALTLLTPPCGLAADDERSGLIGLWQDTPEIASGWSDAYVFFADGRYEFHYNTMDCAKRLVSVSGRWRLTADGLLLTVEDRASLVGGHFEKATGSCGTDTELVDATLKTRHLQPAVERIVTISPITRVTYRNKHDGIGSVSTERRLMIDGREFWKIDDDPNRYELDD